MGGLKPLVLVRTECNKTERRSSKCLITAIKYQLFIGRRSLSENEKPYSLPPVSRWYFPAPLPWLLSRWAVCGGSMRMPVTLHVWAWKTACPDAIPYFPGAPTGTSAKSMLLAKPWPPAPGGNAAIDYMLMQLCRHTWPPAEPQHVSEKLQLPEQTQRVAALKSRFSTHQYPDRDRCVSFWISEGIWEQFSPGTGCFPLHTEWMGSL